MLVEVAARDAATRRLERSTMIADTADNTAKAR
jgi:hypothetical protein